MKWYIWHLKNRLGSFLFSLIRISLKGIKVKAPVGVYPWEKKKGRNFRIDVELRVDFTENELQDKLQNTINYEHVLEIIKECMKEKHDLVETAVSAISNSLFAEFNNLKELKVRIEKINPIPGGKMKSAFVERIFKQM